MPPRSSDKTKGAGGLQSWDGLRHIDYPGYNVYYSFNIWYNPERAQLATNAELIDRIVKIARSEGRDPASPNEARAIIGIPDHVAVM